MLALIIIPIIIVFEILIYKKIKSFINNYKYIKHNKLICIIFLILLFSGILFLLIGFLLPININNLKHLFTSLGYYLLGIELYLLLGLLISIIIRFILNKIINNKYIIDNLIILFIVLFTCIMSTYGISHGHKIVINDYSVEVNKESKLDELNIVLISDLHIGYNLRYKEIKDMVDNINKLDADVVLIAGDIFDNEFAAIKDPDKIQQCLANINSKYGTYCCLGNHDVDEKILLGFTFSNTEACISDKMLKFIENSNIKLLYDDYCLIEDIYIYGRPDKEKINLHNINRLDVNEIMSKMDNNSPIIVLDHEPSDAELFSKTACDLYLNGHTHNGQIWPGTLTIKLIWDNAQGYKKYNNMHNIVTSGIGLFGVNMRIDSNAEICNIKVKFK